MSTASILAGMTAVRTLAELLAQMLDQAEATPVDVEAAQNQLNASRARLEEALARAKERQGGT